MNPSGPQASTHETEEPSVKGHNGVRAEGAYANGIARREEILRVALELFAEKGFQASSTTELARRVGIKNASLFYYFATKQGLLREVLAARDKLNRERLGADSDLLPMESIVAVARNNAKEPGLMRLYATVSAEATDPTHAAHTFFKYRFEQLRDDLEQQLRKGQEEGVVRTGVAPNVLAQLFIAAADGLQVQYLMEPDAVDLPAALESLIRLLHVD